MSNRFNSSFNKPQRVNLISKQRVMADFKDIQESMTAIKQEHVQPGPDPPIPEYLKAHAERMNFVANEGEQTVATAVSKLPQTTINSKTSQAQRTLSQGMETSQMTGFVRMDPEKRELVPLPLKESLMRHRNTLDANLWDAKHFSSMNPKLPIYQRTSAFIDFSSQLDRSEFVKTGMPCNAARFNTIDHFPNSLSRVTHKPKVVFEKQIERNTDNLTKGIQMSDSCYNPADRDRIRLKAARGILHFGNSTLNRKGDGGVNPPKVEKKDDLKPVGGSSNVKKGQPAGKQKGQEAGAKEEKNEQPQPIALDPSDMIEMTQKQRRQFIKNQLESYWPPSDETMLKNGFKKSLMVDLDQQVPRVKHENQLHNCSNDVKIMNKTLPSYFHNIGTRLAVTNLNQKTLRVNQTLKTNYMQLSDGIHQTRKEFRVDPTTQIRIGAQSQPSKKDANARTADKKDSSKAGAGGKSQNGSMQNRRGSKPVTFQQLLAKQGYIQDESAMRERKRPWHVQKNKTVAFDSDDDDDLF